MSSKFFLDGKNRTTFDVFKSNICHRVKDNGDIPFIIEVLQSNVIFDYFEKKWHAECLYLLAMLDYISKENDIPLCADYNHLRQCKLPEIVYPQGIILLASVTNNEQIKVDSFNNSISEFKRFNIVENEIRNVV